MGRTMKLHMSSLVHPILILLFSMSRFYVAEAASFSLDLIHKDTLQSSPYYSSSERVKYSLQRSFIRAKHLIHTSPQLASTQIIADRGEFLMKFSLGTPPVETLAIADTGSDLTWIQCKPCAQCFEQKSPFFDPTLSSTYKPVSCTSNSCSSLQSTSCDISKGTCSYTVSYGDKSSSKGDLATETITLGSTTGENVSLPNVTIGCGRMDQGTFGGNTSGIIGLGGGEVSLIKQMGSSIKGKFSYCLVPFFGETPMSSKINFGDTAIVSGSEVKSTPIVKKFPSTFYSLTLEGITVGKQRFDLVSSFSSSLDYDGGFMAIQEGNIIIDSGTTLTFLPSELYEQVERELRGQINLTEVDDPQGLLKLCYLSALKDVNVPEITVHFRGADLKLKDFNVFVETSEKSTCLAFAPAAGIPIYGNLAQMDFMVGYDLEKNIVSFKPTDCTKA